jgi:hypothetical protein
MVLKKIKHQKLPCIATGLKLFKKRLNNRQTRHKTRLLFGYYGLK